MAIMAVKRYGVGIALACRAFSVSETCYRYSRKLNDDNEQIADLLIGLTRTKRNWGFGLCFRCCHVKWFAVACVSDWA